MVDPKEEMQAEMEKLGKGHSKEFQDIVGNLTTNIFEKGMLPKDAMGLSDGLIEGIYGHAYRLYNSGKYKDASQLFRLLIVLNPTAAKYPLGLAACFHMLKEYENAIATYTMVSLIDIDSPLPFYHASDCYIQLGDITSAIVNLQMTVARCGEKEAFALIKERSIATMESLKQQLDKEEAKIDNEEVKVKKVGA